MANVEYYRNNFEPGLLINMSGLHSYEAERTKILEALLGMNNRLDRFQFQEIHKTPDCDPTSVSVGYGRAALKCYAHGVQSMAFVPTP